MMMMMVMVMIMMIINLIYSAQFDTNGNLTPLCSRKVHTNAIKLYAHLYGHIKACVTKLEHRLVGLVVKASASRAEDPGFEYRLRWDFFGVESYQ